MPIDWGRNLAPNQYDSLCENAGGSEIAVGPNAEGATDNDVISLKDR